MRVPVSNHALPARAAALAKFLPEKDMRAAFRVDHSPRLRFSDLPATSKLVRRTPVVPYYLTRL